VGEEYSELWPTWEEYRVTGEDKLELSEPLVEEYPETPPEPGGEENSEVEISEFAEVTAEE
jgi:hypothetical protein